VRFPACRERVVRAFEIAHQLDRTRGQLELCLVRLGARAGDRMASRHAWNGRVRGAIRGRVRLGLTSPCRLRIAPIVLTAGHLDTRPMRNEALANRHRAPAWELPLLRKDELYELGRCRTWMRTWLS